MGGGFVIVTDKEEMQPGCISSFAIMVFGKDYLINAPNARYIS